MAELLHWIISEFRSGQWASMSGYFFICCNNNTERKEKIPSQNDNGSLWIINLKLYHKKPESLKELI